MCMYGYMRYLSSDWTQAKWLVSKQLANILKDAYNIQYYVGWNSSEKHNELIAMLKVKKSIITAIDTIDKRLASSQLFLSRFEVQPL